MADLNFRRIHLLVVEDNLFMRNLYSAILRAMEFEQIQMAADGSEAFELMRDFPPDIIITDAAMQPLDGFDFVHLVRTAADSPDPLVPIIMVTGYHNRACVERARDVGVNEYLAKPVTPAGLYSRITQVISKPRPYVRSNNYFGPNRRRRSNANYSGPFRRESDKIVGPPTRAQAHANGKPKTQQRSSLSLIQNRAQGLTLRTSNDDASITWGATQ
ncbi:response regulator [Pyruvatibacter sp.]|uniref:response regulator n=1 Tax=Pyruvatibacter sp. TaxID=1981328 RepID=UPI0032ED4F3D